MNVLFINKSDQRGGAAVVTRRLACALKSLSVSGMEVRMLVQEQLLDDADGMVGCYRSPVRDMCGFLAERLQIFMRNGLSKKRLFLVDTAAYGRDLSSHEWVAWADVVVLGWVQQGAMSLAGIERLLKTGKQVVWILHDLWPITGICHLPYDCTKYRTGGCVDCKYLSGGVGCEARRDDGKGGGDLSTDVFIQKQKLYSHYRNITFVAVSHWVKECCDKSVLMTRKHIKCEVVHNIVPPTACLAKDVASVDATASADRDTVTMVMGAARLDDPVKGLPALIQALGETEDRKSLRLVLYGGLRDKSLLAKIPVQCIYKGVLPFGEVEAVMAASDIVLSCSAYETFGATLAEGIAAGCVAVTTGTGGQRDIVDHLHTGYVVEADEPFANGIRWAVDKVRAERATQSHAGARQHRHDEMMRRFAPEVIAGRFARLLLSLCNSDDCHADSGIGHY